MEQNQTQKINNIDKNELWTEKYRPKKINQLLLNESLKNKINYIIENKIINNMIFLGPPGTGKTSTALILSKKLNNESILELNASDNRGLEFISNEVINFCKKKVDDEMKMIIFDEADNITDKAQNILVDIMSKYNKCMIIFTCNDKKLLIEKIQSRCDILYFDNIKITQVINKLQYICKKEQKNIDIDILKYIALTSKGDLRRSIILLELYLSSYHDINKNNKNNTKIKQIINNLCGQLNVDLVINLMQLCKQNNIKQIITQIDILYKDGYQISDILSYMINTINNMNHINNMFDEDMIIQISKILYSCQAEIKIKSKLQLYSCLCKICKLLNDK